MRKAGGLGRWGGVLGREGVQGTRCGCQGRDGVPGCSPPPKTQWAAVGCQCTVPWQGVGCQGFCQHPSRGDLGVQRLRGGGRSSALQPWPGASPQCWVTLRPGAAPGLGRPPASSESSSAGQEPPRAPERGLGVPPSHCSPPPGPRRAAGLSLGTSCPSLHGKKCTRPWGRAPNPLECWHHPGIVHSRGIPWAALSFLLLLLLGRGCHWAGPCPAGAGRFARRGLCVWGAFSSHPGDPGSCFSSRLPSLGPELVAGTASWVRAAPACSAPGCGHGRAPRGTAPLPHRGHWGWPGGAQGEDAGRAEGVSGRRCHCRGIWPGRRRGEREGEEEPGTPGIGDSLHAPHAHALPAGPFGQPLPQPPCQSPEELVPPFPSPVSREIQMFGPSSGIAQTRCPARCFLSPRAGVCAPRLGTPGRGRCSPRASTSRRGFSHVPRNTRGTSGLLPPLPALTSPGGCRCL